MLKVKDLNVHYGKIHAIKGISFEVNEGEIVTLIGANGAGKTTILQTISGLLKPSEGMVSFEGENLNKVPAHQIPVMGIAHVPEGRRIFAEMTVYENLQMGAYIRNDKDQIQEDMEKIFLNFPRLKERIKQIAGTLSGGEQQMLAMGRALMTRPKLILLDEPSMGLAPLLVDEIFNMIQTVNDAGTTVLLVEQNANKALHIANRAYVLETGYIKLSGNARDLLVNPEVQQAYLGG
ncbi:ABC transporter ATP-binding protein [Acetobacterium wieringae]|jgi:branched-chain amino acid transport system ATP-binding protein|uniref:ABC transporter ATP-binding protein n=1 Tax=Acetobacterium wieringae TaxID=52694 RepID=A0A1F2PH70_9FIRM|nr:MULTISPECIES: ABC transporter ATP-binding protein [Acetobacterium]MEA4806486.1 ABC transporter ATP-binding protein [Acetobacterium wieringae]OFV70668.1 high-affinity branched-chain amino acid transport ATP-binding protein LivF [Acetobacterium wieringae]OXS25558.1 MAG: ABC transporter ATP-binding protein [Acetobacterium sp. MES1]TYC88329.1 ABC transporter ATP-binding protein [Acetobacterium wieringae]URN83054.1 ABC transporter ATP-binding protein [Acetobacterium wieringae]